MQKSKRTSKGHRLTRSIMAIFGLNKTNVTFKNHKEQYFKHYYFPKNLCDGIDLVAATERISRKKASEMIMTAGFSNYIAGKVSEQIKIDAAARKRDEKVKRTRFAFVLRKFAREKGIDISRFI